MVVVAQAGGDGIDGGGSSVRLRLPLAVARGEFTFVVPDVGSELHGLKNSWRLCRLVGDDPVFDLSADLPATIAKLSRDFGLEKKIPLRLGITDGMATLKLLTEKTAPDFAPDFSSSKIEFKIKDEIKRRGLLLKAIEGQSGRGISLKIFDFYSGFGQDAFLLACAHHQVISCEKHPIISLVTQTAWEKQRLAEWHEVQPNLQFITGNSRLVLEARDEEFDVVYMDPMFEKLKDSSKSPLPMQIIQELLAGQAEEGENKDRKPPGNLSAGERLKKSSALNEDLLVAARHASKVVVKFPLKGKSSIVRKPSHQVFGKTVRYDIFVQG